MVRPLWPPPTTIASYERGPRPGALPLGEDEDGADVVVCGTRGRGAVARSVLGSTSSSLLHHAVAQFQILSNWVAA